MYVKGMKAKPIDVNMRPAGFKITRILTDYAQKNFPIVASSTLRKWLHVPVPVRFVNE